RIHQLECTRRKSTRAALRCMSLSCASTADGSSDTGSGNPRSALSPSRSRQIGSSRLQKCPPRPPASPPCSCSRLHPPRLPCQARTAKRSARSAAVDPPEWSRKPSSSGELVMETRPRLASCRSEPLDELDRTGVLVDGNLIELSDPERA